MAKKMTIKSDKLVVLLGKRVVRPTLTIIILLLAIFPAVYGYSMTPKQEFDLLVVFDRYVENNYEYRLGVANVDPHIALGMGIYDCTIKATFVKEVADFYGIKTKIWHGYLIIDGRYYYHDWLEHNGKPVEGLPEELYVKVGEGVW